MQGAGAVATAAESDMELYRRVLLFTGQNSKGGQKSVGREDYLRNLRKVFGIGNFQHILAMLQALGRDGLVHLEFLGPDNFRVVMTPLGMKFVHDIEHPEHAEPATPAPSPEPAVAPPVETSAAPEVEAEPVEGPQEAAPITEEAPAPEEETLEGETETSPEEGEAEPDGATSSEGTEGEPPVGEGEEAPGEESSQEAEPAVEETPLESGEGSAEGNAADESEPGITDVIASMQQNLSKVRVSGTPLPPQRPAERDATAFERAPSLAPGEIQVARENLDRREKILRDRSKILSQRELDLTQREETFDETRRLLEQELAKAKTEYDRVIAETRGRLAKLEAREKEENEREKALAARIASLQEREDALMKHAGALYEQEQAIERIEAQRTAAREGLKQAHRDLGAHWKRHRSDQKQ